MQAVPLLHTPEVKIPASPRHPRTPLNSCFKRHQSIMAPKKEKIIRVIWWFQMCFPLETTLKGTKTTANFSRMKFNHHLSLM